MFGQHVFRKRRPVLVALLLHTNEPLTNIISEFMLTSLTAHITVTVSAFVHVMITLFLSVHYFCQFIAFNDIFGSSTT